MESVYQEAEQIIKELQNRNKFRSKYMLVPDATSTLKKIENFIEKIERINTSSLTLDEIGIFEEVKRNMKTEREVLILDSFSERFTYEDLFRLYSIQKEDVESLEPWILENKEKVCTIVAEKYTKAQHDFKLALAVEVIELRNRAVRFAGQQIKKYFNTLVELIENISGTGTQLRQLKAKPISIERSYINYTFKRIGIAVTDIIEETKEGELKLNEKELIRLIGHEGMGHGLQYVVSQTSNLPYVLKETLVAAYPAMESLASHFGRMIFEDIKNNPETQIKLGIQNSFENIYREEIDERLLTEYKQKRFYHTITILADKTLNETQRLEKINETGKVNGKSADPLLGLTAVSKHRFNYDDQGNLHQGVLKELIYCARPVEKSLQMIKEQLGENFYQTHRQEIDKMFLTGFYTSQGFIEKTKNWIKQRM